MRTIASACSGRETSAAVAVACPPVAAISSATAGRGPLARRSRKAWRTLALGLLLWGVGDILWFFYEIVLESDAFPSAADAACLAGYPVMLVALLLFPSAPRERTDRWKFTLDVGMVFVAATVAIWHFGLRPIAASGAFDLTTVLSAAYSVGDAVLMFGVTMLLFCRPPADLRSALGLVQAGLVFTVLADVVFAYQEVQGTYANGGWADQFFALGDLMFIFGAQYQAWAASHPARAQEAGAEGQPSLSPLPHAAVAVAYGVMLIVESHDLNEAVAVPILAAGLVTLLAVARQFVALLENRRLLLKTEALSAEVRRSEARFRTLVENAPDVIVVLNDKGKIVYESPSVERILGHSPTHRLGADGLSNVHPEDLAQVQTTMADLVAHPGAVRTIVCRGRHADGSWRWLEVTATNLLHDPNVRGLVGNYRDITEQRALEEQLAHWAFHDTLTGLANRALFHNCLARALARNQRYDYPVAVLFLDLDDFKTVNDGLGHSAGDELLVTAASRLRGCLRETDTAARLGGDEFAILLEDAEVERAKNVAQRVLDALNRPFVLGDREIVASASIGIAVHEHGPGDADELLRNADMAMYEAKTRGKNRAEVFCDKMYEAARTRLQLKADLQRAIGDNALVLHYQPIVSLETGQIVALEALLRYDHPDRGLVPPLEFIPLAEETGLILPLGRWVLRQACQQARDWQQRFATEPPLQVSVNLSPRQLEDPDLYQDVAAALRESGLRPEDLELEITESALLQDTEALRQRLAGLKWLGVRLATDDFGTGYSSLNYLQRLPLDFLKIDRSFIKGLNDDGARPSLVGSIVDMARSFRLRTIAEGVETLTQEERLRELGCDLAQGFLYARPLTPEAVDEVLRAAAQGKSPARRKAPVGEG